ncbi:hypothetical protein ASG58_17605 [Rhizobium sp. Leaf383]|nr:hypothetical protein ASG58_17605 [Rhizobium sp. Leaf383]
MVAFLRKWAAIFIGIAVAKLASARNAPPSGVRQIFHFGGFLVTASRQPRPRWIRTRAHGLASSQGLCTSQPDVHIEDAVHE